MSIHREVQIDNIITLGKSNFSCINSLIQGP